MKSGYRTFLLLFRNGAWLTEEIMGQPTTAQIERAKTATEALHLTVAPPAGNTIGLRMLSALDTSQYIKLAEYLEASRPVIESLRKAHDEAQQR